MTFLNAVDQVFRTLPSGFEGFVRFGKTNTENSDRVNPRHLSNSALQNSESGTTRRLDR